MTATRELSALEVLAEPERPALVGAASVRPPLSAPAHAVPATSVFRPDIQGLRAIAVTLVVLYHAGIPLLHGGYVGVDVFFVISGYLITAHLLTELQQTGRIALGRFWVGRIRRLLPAALIVMATTVVVARIWGPPLQARPTALDTLFSALYSINFRLAAQGVDYQQATGPASPLQHFWSLAVEEQFYLLWPIVLLVATVLFSVVLRRRHARLAVTLVSVAVLVTSLRLSISLTASEAPLAYFAPQTRAWEFAAGALVAALAPTLSRIWPTVLGLPTWTGLGVILASAFIFDDLTPFPGAAAVLPVAGTALVIIGGLRTGGLGADALLRRRSFQLIGNLSYTWYLWHWPVILLAPAIFHRTFNWWENLELAVIALWFAALTTLLIEAPARSNRRGRSGRYWLTVVGALTAVVVGVASVAAVIAPNLLSSGAAARPLQLRGPATLTLDAALARAVSNNLVPANLTPSLSAAAADVPRSQGDGCHLNFLQTVQGACAYGDVTASRTAVIFGDSHAQQWDGAFDAAGKQSGWRILSWTKAACPVAALSLIDSTLRRPYTECDTWRTQTIARIRALHPQDIFLSQSDSVPGDAVSDTTWAEDTAATVRQLTMAGTRTLFIADTPYPKTNVPDCLAQNLTRVRTCAAAPGSVYKLGQARHDAVGRAVSAARATYIEPKSWLCTRTLCPVVVDDVLVYRDSSHLTNTMSQRLSPLISSILTSKSASARP
jgi:peptidoglycan/LPS O-acetylase OafA/YrhL